MRVSLQARSRPTMTKGEVKRLRLEGYVPVTISAPGGETMQACVPTRELTEALRRGGQSALFELHGLGNHGKTLVIARDIQREPISGHILHVGFRHLSAREPVTAPIRVVLTGEPEAVRTKTAVLEQEADTIEVRAMPDRLPSHIEVDTSGMELGGVLHVSDIRPSDNYEIRTSPETVVAVVHTVRAAVTPQEEEQTTGEEAGTQEAETA